MTKGEKPTYCWDTNTLLAWMNQETEQHPIADIGAVVDEVDGGQANLILPAPVFSEVFTLDLTPGQRERLDGVLERSNVHTADLTVPIARRAALIRERGHQENPKRRLGTVDAQIAATALGLNADVLHALDSDLLKLSGHATAEGLLVTKPRPISGQKGLC